MLLAAGFWAGLPGGLPGQGGGGLAAWARQGGSGSGGSGSGGSGSGSSGGGDDDAGDDDGGDDHSGDDHSGDGSGGEGAGSGGSGRGVAEGGGKDWLPGLGADGIHVQFFDGHIERIRAGRFEKIDKSGRVVERRRATAQEDRRLQLLRSEFTQEGKASGIATIADVDERAGRVEITDFRGWRETLSAARYQLRDPNGRTVSRRALTPEDVARLRSLLFLN